MARYIIAAERFTSVESNALSNYLDNSHFQFWHWIENFWLVIIPDTKPPETTEPETPTEIASEWEQAYRDMLQRRPGDSEWEDLCRSAFKLDLAIYSSSAKALWDKIVAEIPSIEPKTILVMRIDDPISYWGKAGPPDRKAWKWFEANGIKNW